jgi:Leucine-rich repeat (LRR) protein
MPLPVKLSAGFRLCKMLHLTAAIVFLLFLPVTKVCCQRILEPEELHRLPIFRNLSDALANPDTVYRLSLKGKKLTYLPAEIFLFKNLQWLDLSRNRFTEISDSIGQLIHLTELNLSYNKLKTLPPAIGNLKHLTVLKLQKNHIKRLPAEMGQLRNLEVLELWDNEIDVFPEEMSQCRLLRKLDLRGILMTDEEQHAIQALFPHTKIYFSASCTCKD